MNYKKGIIFLNMGSLAVYIATITVFLRYTWVRVICTPEELIRFSKTITSTKDISVIRTVIRSIADREYIVIKHAETISRFYLILTGCFLVIFIFQIVLWSKDWHNEKKSLATTPPSEN